MILWLFNPATSTPEEKMDGRGNKYKVLTLSGLHGVDELISSYAFDLGCLGLETIGAKTNVYFPMNVDIQMVGEGLRELLISSYGYQGIDIECGTVEDAGWELLWRRHFEPLWIGNDLLILAPWHNLPNKTPLHTIIMDPGPAFGTGRHASTRLCLSALKEVSGLISAPWSLLDVGTGSGILAIYGAMLGACPVMGIDIDEEALRWAERNVELNKLKGKVTFSKNRPSQIKESFNIVVSNITFQEFTKLLPELRETLSEGGILILSGILNAELGQMVEILHKERLTPIHKMSEDEWVCLWATKTRDSATLKGLL